LTNYINQRRQPLSLQEITIIILKRNHYFIPNELLNKLKNVQSITSIRCYIPTSITPSPSPPRANQRHSTQISLKNDGKNDITENLIELETLSKFQKSKQQIKNETRTTFFNLKNQQMPSSTSKTGKVLKFHQLSPNQSYNRHKFINSFFSTTKQSQFHRYNKHSNSNNNNNNNNNNEIFNICNTTPVNKEYFDNYSLEKTVSDHCFSINKKIQQEFLSLSLSPPLNRRREMPALRGGFVSL